MTFLSALPGGPEIILLLITFGLIYIPTIFYLITLQSIFEIISTQNRKMPSNNVWLLLIPLFGTVWHFIVINNLIESIKLEANLIDVEIKEPKSTYNIGLAMCILNALFILPGLNVLTSIAGIVCWIIFWEKINSYKTVLLNAKNNSNSIKNYTISNHPKQ